MAILDFSFSGWHGFGSITQVCFGISVSNFMCMSFVAVGRNLTIVSYVAFKMAALWFWTMPPSPMGRGYPSRSLIYNFLLDLFHFWHDCWPWSIDYLIRFWLIFVVTLTDFSRSNMEFAISQPKMVRLPRNEKQTYRLNSRAQMWPSGLTMTMTLT